MQRVRVAHRDIKPDNILFDPSDSSIVVVNFGTATLSPTLDNNSFDSIIYSTRAYAAPEALRERGGSHRVMARELWSLGIVLFEMLEGKQPFRCLSTDHEVLLAHRRFPSCFVK